MPVYEFTCQGCGERFDKFFRTMSSPAEATCPKCGSKRSQRTLSLVNAGERKSAGETGPSSGAMPFCGRCGGPGPCGMQ